MTSGWQAPAISAWGAKGQSVPTLSPLEENSGLFRTQGSRGDFRAALSLISAHFTHVSVKRTVGGAKEVVRLVTVSCPNGWSF